MSRKFRSSVGWARPAASGVGRGRSLDAFLRQFPTLTREQAVAVIEEAEQQLAASAEQAE